MSIGESYSNIKKVYSINIVYFDLGRGDDCVYRRVVKFKFFIGHEYTLDVFSMTGLVGIAGAMVTGGGSVKGKIELEGIDISYHDESQISIEKHNVD